jgi:predicted RND superfamily exporter protein
MITNEEVQKYLFDGEDTITPELPNKYAEVIERVRQKEKQQEDKKESTIQIKRKAELENIKKFLKTQEQKSEDEIAKKIKRKTLKQKFTELGKKVLNKIGDFLLNEEIFEEENALLEESIYEKQGRSK